MWRRVHSFNGPRKGIPDLKTCNLVFFAPCWGSYGGGGALRQEYTLDRSLHIEHTHTQITLTLRGHLRGPIRLMSGGDRYRENIETDKRALLRLNPEPWCNEVNAESCLKRVVR